MRRNELDDARLRAQFLESADEFTPPFFGVTLGPGRIGKDAHHRWCTCLLRHRQHFEDSSASAGSLILGQPNVERGKFLRSPFIFPGNPTKEIDGAFGHVSHCDGGRYSMGKTSWSIIVAESYLVTCLEKSRQRTAETRSQAWIDNQIVRYAPYAK